MQVAWDEAAPTERRTRVSLWEVEPVIAPFFIYPSPLFTAKRPRQPGITGKYRSTIVGPIVILLMNTISA
jgi:hypothetical protein